MQLKKHCKAKAILGKRLNPNWSTGCEERLDGLCCNYCPKARRKTECENICPRKGKPCIYRMNDLEIMMYNIEGQGWLERNTK